MVQIKEIFKNFLPNFYKKTSKKIYTKKSFLIVVGSYFSFLIFWLVGKWAGNSEGVISKASNSFINTFSYLMILIILFNIMGFLLFDKKIEFQKYFALGLYFSGMFFCVCIVALLTSLVNGSYETFIFKLFFVIILVTIEVLYNFILVSISLSKSNLSIRDKGANYYINLITIIGGILIVLATQINNENLLHTGMLMAISSFLCVGIFHFPRVIRYWKKPPEIDLNKSAYGNSIEMMKNKRTKK
ncbi:hypothetical protein D7L51_12375 [Enterococcus faecalis]|nr:hypothetical protein [Enterococcus faecalis]EGO8859957.1 hypothetical protein [Enterococcus faecalis]